MPSSSLPGFVGAPKTSTVDLYCTSCDSQIGTYENEWIRLTSSYIISRVNGTKFGINVAEEHRTVDAKDATALHGCDLSEASCSKCSRAIGHFCRNAPGKPHLVGQYIYRMSRTHPKQTRTSARVGFNFTFGANQPQQDRVRSMVTAPPRPAHSPSPYLYSARNEATRQSMGPPSSRPNNGIVIDPALTALVSTPPNNRENSIRSAESTSEGKIDARERNLILQRLEEQDNKLTSLSESINDWKIQNGRLVGALMRSSPQALNQQDISGPLETLIDDFESMVNAAHEARSGNDELEVLRTENESMKAKLQTIASAMGTAIESNTPNSQPFTSPMTACSTPSMLGKRKRIDARNRHSLLQNEVSFTDEDDLNDQSGLYAVSNPSQSRSTPARQSERPSTISSAEARAGPAMAELSRTAVQVLSPPDSSFADQHGRQSCSPEPDPSSDMEPECSGSNAPEVDESIRESNVDSGAAEDRASEIVERHAARTTTIEDVAGDDNEISSRISRPQRARKPTPKVACVTDHEKSENVEKVVDMHQTGGALPTGKEAEGLRNMESQARAANGLGQRTTSVLPYETDGEEERHRTDQEKVQHRKTMNTFPDKVNFNSRDRGDPSRPTRLQRITRGNVSHQGYEQVTGNAKGYADIDERMSDGRAEEDVGQDTSLMTMNDEEEREELFEGYQNGHHELQANDNNKEIQWPVYAESIDWSQSRQPSRRNRDPNRQKRVRRKPEEIERKYKCLFPGCTKAYGELPHLNTHIGDSDHGERWSKSEYLTASKQGNAVGGIDQAAGTRDGLLPTTFSQDDSRDVERSTEERNAEDAVAALKRNQGRVDGVDKIRQRDRMAKEAMEREELMELMNVA